MDPEVAKWREDIDILDRILLTVLELRLTASVAVAHRKKAIGLKVFDPARELELTRRAHPSVRPIYAEIIRRCREAGVEATR